jgi:hypothetical protein
MSAIVISNQISIELKLYSYVKDFTLDLSTGAISNVDIFSVCELSERKEQA